MKKKLPVVITALVCALIIYLLYFSPYPAFKQFKQRKYSTAIYDSNGYLLQVTSLENGLRREWTSLKEIPKPVQKAFIQSEDRRFYFHCGVDVFSVCKAAVQNLKAGRTVRGASTITMQLVKIIDRGNGEYQKKSRAARKLCDVANAFRLEARLTKRQILEYYLNNVPFGLNTEGVTSAGRSFFCCELSELSVEQAKCLSVVPRRPSLYNPVLNPEECALRAGVAVDVAEKARLYEYPFYVPHYVKYLQNSNQLNLKGKTVTAIDFKLQQKAEGFLRTAMEQARDARISNGAVLILDNHTGKVLTWIGNNNWYDEAHHGQVDGVLAANQPGSSMKPFLYALALDSKQNNRQLYYPSKVIPDIQKEFGSEKLYIPANFNNQFNGPVRLRIALASSLNIPAVTVLNDLGVDNYLEKLYELGFNSLKKGGKAADLGLALGAGEVSLKELVTAFSVFVRDGKDFDGNQLYSVDTSRLICSILSDSSARALGFGYTQTFQTEYPSIFKTGTANQYQNIVALGATKNYTIGVWMGNFEGQTVVGKTGSSLPAYVAKQLLDLLESSKPVDFLKFAEPENWHQEKLCSLSGMKAGKNCTAAIYDYVSEDCALQECTWHQKVDGEVKVVYPAEYESWLLAKKLSADVNHMAVPLQIVTPQNNALFYYSLSNKENQSIRAEVIGGDEQSLEVYMDGEFLEDVERPFIFQLPVKKGRHNFTVTCGSQSVSQEYIVQ